MSVVAERQKAFMKAMNEPSVICWRNTNSAPTKIEQTSEITIVRSLAPCRVLTTLKRW